MQTYISGRGSSQRQANVHTAIKMLLGLDTLRMAVEDIDAAYKRLRAEAAQSGGAVTSELEEQLEELDSQVSETRAEEAKLTEALNNMTTQRTQWDKELNALQGIGDIDDLNARIAKRGGRATGPSTHARSRSIARMRHLLKSEPCSDAFLGAQLDEGSRMLSDLADRQVIPGTSLSVLDDRLELAGVHLRRAPHPWVESRRACDRPARRATEGFRVPAAAHRVVPHREARRGRGGGTQGRRRRPRQPPHRTARRVHRGAGLPEEPRPQSSSN